MAKSTIRVFRIIETTPNGARQLDMKLTQLWQRDPYNVRGTKFAECPRNADSVFVRVEIEVYHGQPAFLRRWFRNLTNGWLKGFQVFEIEDVEVRHEILQTSQA